MRADHRVCPVWQFAEGLDLTALYNAIKAVEGQPRTSADWSAPPASALATLKEPKARFVSVLQEAGVRVSMDGCGRWMDNVFTGRSWQSVKYECIYLHAFEAASELRAGLRAWVGLYNERRPHSAHGGRTPDEVYKRVASAAAGQ